MGKFGMAFCLFAAVTCRQTKVRAFGILPSFTTRTASSSTWNKALFSTATPEKESEKKLVPVTLLSGFLGSGKTTALKNLLENGEGVKIGVIVNDVAAVNIDAKLISNPGNNGDGSKAPDNVMAELGGTVELQNGCACCSLSDELLTSMESLMDGRDFDAVVVELSGVADPVAVKQNWEQAKMMQHKATTLADITRVVTVVDACTFGTDWMTWNTAGDRDGWVDAADDCSAQRKVPELLAEQVEAADLLLVNKIDMAGKEQVAVASSVARGLNKDADLFEVEFGIISPKEILGDGIIKEKKKEDKSCSDPDCKDETHDHSHSHDHDSACADPDCTDDNHEHSHSHENESSSCSDPKCTDDSHEHSHSHDHDSSCSDPDCTDTSHEHSHEHKKTSHDKLGISNFVYKAAIPFSPGRLLGLLNQWPVPIKEDLNIEVLETPKAVYQFQEGLDSDSPFIGVLRSKGFCWMAPTKWTGLAEDTWRHETANYWSHAGKHFGIQTAGKWWATLPKDRMKGYFEGNMKEYDRILREDWASEEFGDRRQEIVFIGASIDQKAITDALNECLLTDEEMAVYRKEAEKVYGAAL